jgi:tetratricopeptide (TPR) repeat protein
MTQDNQGFDDSVEWLSAELPIKQRPPKRRVAHWVGIAAAILLVMLTLGVGVHRHYRLSNPLEVHVTAHGLGDQVALRTEAVEAFTAFDGSSEAMNGLTSKDREEFDSIASFFKQVQACVPDASGGEAVEDNTEANDESFRKLVDINALMKRIELTGQIPGDSNALKRELRGELLISLEADSDWAEIKIVKVLVPQDEASSRVVYAFTSNQHKTVQSEYRFVLTGNVRGWKLCDWEQLDVGTHISEEWGIYARYWNSSSFQGYISWGNVMGEADQLMNAGDYDGAKKKLLQGEAYIVPPELYNLRCLFTAYRWRAVGDDANTKRCLELITKRDEMPGAYFGLMNCCLDTDIEKALHLTQKYEKAIGPTPDLCMAKAQILESMGRREQANEEWRKLLRINPDDSQALRQIFESLPSERKHEISTHIARASGPEQVILSLADTVAWSDPDSLPILVTELEKVSPETAASINLQGLLHEVDGNYRASADSFQRAFKLETDSDKRNQYASRYLEMKSRLGEGPAAWHEMPDPESTFADLAYSYEEGEGYLSNDEFREITKHYQQKSPESPGGYYYSAQLAIEAENYEEAEPLLWEALRLAEAQGEEESLVHPNSVAHSLGGVLYKLDKTEELLKLESERKGIILALTRGACYTKNIDELRTLMELCLRVSPDEPLLDLFRAELAVNEKQWDEALSRLKSVELSENEWFFRNRLYEVSVNSGKTLECYAEAEDKKKVFVSLATAIYLERRWEDLYALVAEHQKQFPEDIEMAKALANAAREQKDDEDYVRYAEQILNHPSAGDLASYELSNIEDGLFKSHLRAMNFGSALELAQKTQDKKFESLQMALVNAATGNLPVALRASFETAEKSRNAWQLYRDPDVGHIFLGDEFRELHKKYPIELTIQTAPVSVVFLAEQPWKLSADELKVLLDRVGITASGPIKEVKSLRQEVTAAFVIPLGGAIVWVMTGEGEFDPAWKMSRKEHALTETVADCGFWLAWGVGGWGEKNRKATAESARNVAVESAAGAAKVLFAPSSQDYWEYEAYPAQPGHLEHWRSSGDMQLLTDTGLRIEYDYTSQEESADREFDIQLAETAVRFRSTPGTELELLANFRPELGICPLRVKVTEVRRGYGGPEFVGKVIEDSNLVKELREGLTVEIDAGMVYAWRMNSDPVIFRKVQAQKRL